MKLRNILWSWDFIFSVLATGLVYLILPHWVSSDFAKDLYSVGISVLSIVFSVYFAALAIIMSSSDDAFIRFLEQKNQYTTIIQSFELSLAVLFIALIYSITIYASTSYWISKQCADQRVWWLVVFTFLFFYGILTAASSTLNAITYSKFRSRFLTSQPEQNDTKSASGA
jgi:hypothetical protein